jgi:uncharacterized membrane protein
MARLILAVPFAVTALHRLVDPLAARRSLAEAGMPVRAVAVTVSGLTLAELAVAAGLLSGTTARSSALLALVCLAVPAVPAAIQLARVGTTDARVATVLRANVLAVPAVVVVWLGWADAGPSAGEWLSSLAPGQLFAVASGGVVLAVVSGRAGPQPPAAAPPLPVAAPRAREDFVPVPLVRPAPVLTIGMATYDDFDGVYFTLQSLRLYHDLEQTELLVVDNFGCRHTWELVRDWAGATYLLADDVVGTAAPKDLVFRTASGEAVLCCDSHVLFAPGVVARLKRFYRDDPTCGDLLQGPLVYDDGTHLSSHFEPVWRDQMWGIWATDPRALDPTGEPFDIPMQGLGAFSCRTDAWPGFHPGFRGFGGEEGYLHEKFRRAGRRCLCLPWLRWMHRFGRPRGTPYPLTVEDKLRNYVLGHTELGLDLTPVLAHFTQYLPTERVAAIATEAAGGP